MTIPESSPDSLLLPRRGPYQPPLPFDVLGPVVDYDEADRLADEPLIFGDGIDAGIKSSMSSGLALNTEERFNDYIMEQGYSAPFTVRDVQKFLDDNQWGDFAAGTLACALDRLTGRREQEIAKAAGQWKYESPAAMAAAREAAKAKTLAAYEESYDPAGDHTVREDGIAVRMYRGDGKVHALVNDLVSVYSEAELTEIGGGDPEDGLAAIRDAFMTVDRSQLRIGKSRPLSPTNTLILDKI